MEEQRSHSQATGVATKSVTNTKLAVATAFLGMAALAAAAGMGSSTKACISSNTYNIESGMVRSCAGDTVAINATSGYFFVKGATKQYAHIIPLEQPFGPVYAVGGTPGFRVSAGQSKSYTNPSNPNVEYTIYFRGLDAKGNVNLYFKTTNLAFDATVTVGVNNLNVVDDESPVPDAFVNVYSVQPYGTQWGQFEVIKAKTYSMNGAEFVTVTVAPGEMVYFEGYINGDIAKAESLKKIGYKHIAGTQPPYKNFLTKPNQICQTNGINVDAILMIDTGVGPTQPSCGEGFQYPALDMQANIKLPDLIVKDVTFSSVLWANGTSTVQMNVLIQNIGEGTAVGPSGLGITVQSFGVNADGSVFPGPGQGSSDALGVTQLDPGQELLIPIIVYLPSVNLDKVSKITFVVDMLNERNFIAESNKNNNELTKSVSDLWKSFLQFQPY